MTYATVDRRYDLISSKTINNAELIVQNEGIGLALDYMLISGIPRKLALRVLTAPQYRRG